MVRTQFLVAAMASVVLLVLTGCTPVPKANELVGVWEFSQQKSEYQSVGEDGQIQFKADGTFIAEHIPFDVINPGEFDYGSQSSASPTDSERLQGTWTILEHRLGVSTPAVKLEINPADHFTNGLLRHLEVRGSGPNRTLYFELADPDIGYHYVLTKRR